MAAQKEDRSTVHRRTWIHVQEHTPIDEIIDKMDVCFNRICKCIEEEEATGVDRTADTWSTARNRRGVRYKAAARSLPEPFGQANDYMKGILSKTATSRDQLMEQFGDCEQLAHMQQLLDKIQQLLPGDFANDERLQACVKACASVEDVLQANGLADKFRAKMLEAKEDVDEMSSKTGKVTKVAEGGKVTKVASEAPQRERIMTALETSPQRDRILTYLDNAPRERILTYQEVPQRDRQQLLEAIDDLMDEADTKAEGLKVMEELFELYSDDKGLIEGANYEEAISDVTKYVKMEWDARNKSYVECGKEKLAQALGEFNEAKCAWVRQTIDVDGDGCIAKSEMMQGLVKCVNEVERKNRS